MKTRASIGVCLAGAVLLSLGQSALAQDRETSGDQADLAQELTNPLADLLSIPVQMNWDSGIGPVDDGSKLQTNIQPVYPVTLGDDWNLITRTILPVISQRDVYPGAGSQFGLGDINLSLFLSPRKASSGVVWGVGPVLYLRTATDELLGARKWGAGPAAVALTMRGRWTAGALANHIWSFAGDSARDDINNTFIQPFVAYTWPSAWTLSVLSETTYNWEIREWTVPLNVGVTKLVMFGRLPVSLQAGVGRWLTSPDVAADGWRFRFQATLVLPTALLTGR